MPKVLYPRCPEADDRALRGASHWNGARPLSHGEAMRWREVLHFDDLPVLYGGKNIVKELRYETA